jgi:hypothetical protein
MAEEDEDESPHVNTDETDEEVQNTSPAFDDNLDSEVDDFTIRRMTASSWRWCIWSICIILSVL